jgi:hypothetical protein
MTTVLSAVLWLAEFGSHPISPATQNRQALPAHTRKERLRERVELPLCQVTGRDELEPIKKDDSQKSVGHFRYIPSTTKYVYIKSTTVYVPSSELGLSQPVSRQRVCPSSPNRGRGGAHSPAGEWLGESQFRRLEKKLSTLPTLCPQRYRPLELESLPGRKEEGNGGRGEGYPSPLPHPPQVHTITRKHGLQNCGGFFG